MLGRSDLDRFANDVYPLIAPVFLLFYRCVYELCSLTAVSCVDEVYSLHVCEVFGERNSLIVSTHVDRVSGIG